MYSDKRVRFTVIEIRNLFIKIIGFSSIKNYFDVRRHVEEIRCEDRRARPSPPPPPPPPPPRRLTSNSRKEVFFN